MKCLLINLEQVCELFLYLITSTTYSWGSSLFMSELFNFSD